MTALLGFAGKYQLEVAKVDALGLEIPGSRRVALPWFDNLITSAGLDLLGSTSGDNLTYCRLGTGNTVPSNSDTSLVAQVGSSSTAGLGGVVGVSVGGDYVFRRRSVRFDAGSVSGVNLAEVGMGATISGTIFSRALLKDSGGVPTTITLAADEILDVVYELRMYLPAQDITTVATVDGVSTTITMRHAENVQQLTNWANSLGNRLVNTASQTGFYAAGAEESLPPVAGWAPGSAPGGNAAAAGYMVSTLAPYVSGSYTTTYTMQAELGKCNYATGIGALLMGTTTGSDARYATASFGPWAWGFSPKLNKTSSRTASITVGITWGRYVP